MTQAQLSNLYGPVAEDMILVEDLLESVKQTDNFALTRMMEHALEARGKRLRPGLVLLSGCLGDYDLNRLVPLGAAIELLHTASLVHDDVVDGALSRRGRPTSNAIFDNAITVLLGDYMFANAAEMVTRTGSLEVTRLFALTLMKMTNGELDQDAAAFNVGNDVQQYLGRIGGKTAALFANATEGGAILGKCSADGVAAMRTYGYSIGMAFQIVDDVLDFTGDEATMGKPVGGDLREGTLTLPGLLLLERYPRNNPIKRLFMAKRDREKHLQASLAMVLDTEVLDASMDIARDYVRRGIEAIEPLPAGSVKESLVRIADYVLERQN